MMQLGAVQQVAPFAIQQVSGRLVAGERLAQDRLVALAIKAVAAVRIPRAHHVVARLDRGDIRAHPLDHAGAFVPQHDRQRIGQRSLHDFEIGVA